MTMNNRRALLSSLAIFGAVSAVGAEERGTRQVGSVSSLHSAGVAMNMRRPKIYDQRYARPRSLVPPSPPLPSPPLPSPHLTSPHLPLPLNTFLALCAAGPPGRHLHAAAQSELDPGSWRRLEPGPLDPRNDYSRWRLEPPGSSSPGTSRCGMGSNIKVLRLRQVLQVLQVLGVLGFGYLR